MSKLSTGAQQELVQAVRVRYQSAAAIPPRATLAP
jgi:hypothetical protein